MTVAEIDEVIGVERAVAESRYFKSLDEYRAKAEKYRAMKERVTAWERPSPDHENLKKFMLDEIRGATERETEPVHVYEPIDAETWRAQRIEMCNRSIAYHEKQEAEEAARVISKNKWLSELRKSVPPPQS